MKIRPVAAELLQADGQTDIRLEQHDEANNRFSKLTTTALYRNIVCMCFVWISEEAIIFMYSIN